MEGTCRGQLADTWLWAERAGTGWEQERGRERGYGWGQASSAAAPPSHPILPARTGPAVRLLCPSLHPAHGSVSQGSASTWISVLQAQKVLGQGPPEVPGTHRAHTATPRHPTPGGHGAPAHRHGAWLTSSTGACGAEHRRLSPVCRRDQADPLLKHQRCSKFFNLPNRSISNYHVSHS